ncbi:MAG TPA: hypothetical protein VEC36_06260 [Patescibacteria group bacterium]|nr:hypothetical protein [Patescibacteria group bacterium]
MKQRRKILFICGSLNQTTMMHQIAKHLPECEVFYTPYYADGFLQFMAEHGFADFTVLGGPQRRNTERYLSENNLPVDFKGQNDDYDLVVTCSDLIVPKNIRDKKVVLVQEGMTDPRNMFYYLAKYCGLPRYLASTSTTGLSDAYNVFCVASEGYRDHFIRSGVRPEKIAVTGIPNFDNCAEYLKNDFPHKGYVLVATSDARETFKYENRKAFILKAVEIANGRQLIFKLHPNENVERATREINKWAPGALVYSTANTNHLIANCETLITRFSSVVYVGIALGKEVYSEFDIEELRRLTPIQNGCRSAENIARICRSVMNGDFYNGSAMMKNPVRKLEKSYKGKLVPAMAKGKKK